MLFYQVGEFFQSLAVERSRKSISDLMDIRPDCATVRRNGAVSYTHLDVYKRQGIVDGNIPFVERLHPRLFRIVPRHLAGGYGDNVPRLRQRLGLGVVMRRDPQRQRTAGGKAAGTDISAAIQCNHFSITFVHHRIGFSNACLLYTSLSGAIAELLLWKMGYGNAKALTISYVINQVLAAFGSTIIPYAIAAKAMADQMVTDGRQDAILAASQMLQSWVSVALVAGLIVAAFIGAMIGKRIVKKHLAA